MAKKDKEIGKNGSFLKFGLDLTRGREKVIISSLSLFLIDQWPIAIQHAIIFLTFRKFSNLQKFLKFQKNFKFFKKCNFYKKKSASSKISLLQDLNKNGCDNST